MSELSRRNLLAVFGAAGLSARALAEQIHQSVRDIQSLDQGANYTPQFFTPHEYSTLRLLTDFMIPADANSKGAIDAGAAEFIDFVCSKSDDVAGYYRYNLGFIDQQMQSRAGANFIDAPLAEQTKFLDLISYRSNWSDLTGAAVDFFAYFRFMVVDAYYTSPVGIAGLGYMGNQVLTSFTVPEEAVQYALKRSPFGGG